jgi:hypothetical protein
MEKRSARAPNIRQADTDQSMALTTRHAGNPALRLSSSELSARSSKKIDWRNPSLQSTTVENVPRITVCLQPQSVLCTGITLALSNSVTVEIVWCAIASFCRWQLGRWGIFPLRSIGSGAAICPFIPCWAGLNRGSELRPGVCIGVNSMAVLGQTKKF